MKKLLIGLTLATALFSCKKDDVETPEPEETKYGNVKFMIEHTFNDEALDKESKFVTENGDTIVVSQLKYFISNIVFKNETDELAMEDSYHLIELSDDSNINKIELNDLEEADYTSFNFSLGVDSTANYSIENAAGDLDPNGADQMIWSWSTGYKFVRFEGNYTSEDSSDVFVFHIGKNENYKTFDFDNVNISLEDSKTTTIHIKVDLAEFFVSPTIIDLETTNRAHGDAASSLMDNIATSEDSEKNGWFELHHIMTE